MTDKLEQHEFMSEIQCFDCDAHLRNCTDLSKHLNLMASLLTQEREANTAMTEHQLDKARELLEEMQAASKEGLIGGGEV